MVTTNQNPINPIVGTLKIKESKHTTKDHQTTKKKEQRGTTEQPEIN